MILSFIKGMTFKKLSIMELPFSYQLMTWHSLSTEVGEVFLLHYTPITTQ